MKVTLQGGFFVSAAVRYLQVLPIRVKSSTRFASLAAYVTNKRMNTYRIRIAFRNPSGLTFRQLDEVLTQHRFHRAQPCDGLFRYSCEYQLESEEDLCRVCELAYSQACQVRGCPLILVEKTSQK